MTSCGNNFNDFPENQLTKSRAVYTVKANQGPKFCRYSFTQNSSTVTMITEGRTCNSLDKLRHPRSDATATSSFIKPKSGCITFHACLHCRFTICNYEILTKSIVCPTNPTVTYCSFSSNTVSRLIEVQFTVKRLVSKRPPK